MSPNEMIEKLQWRYAVKKFNADKKIDATTWKAIEDSLVLTPSSYGLQPWKFLIVQNPELKKTLREHSWNQSQVEDCSHYVVFLGRKTTTEEDIEKYIQYISDVRGTDLADLEGFKNGMIGDLVKGPRSHMISEWAARQVYIALGQAMSVAASLDVDACPMEGIDPVQYDKILNLESTGMTTLCSLAMGYRSDEDIFSKMQKIRYPHEEIIEHR